MTESTEASAVAATEAPKPKDPYEGLPDARDVVGELLADEKLTLSAAFRAWDVTRDRLEAVSLRALAGAGQRPYAEVRRMSNDGKRASLEEAYACARMVLAVQLFCDVSDVPTAELLLSGFHAHYEEQWGAELTGHVRRAYEGLLANQTEVARGVRQRARERKAEDEAAKAAGAPSVTGPNAYEVELGLLTK